MTTQPEALPLSLLLAQVAPYIDTSERGQWIMGAAAELRRLHEAHEWQYTMAGQRLRRIEKLEALNQELLEFVKDFVNIIEKHGSIEGSEKTIAAIARAAINKAERTTT